MDGAAAAKWLQERNIRIVRIDAPGIDGALVGKHVSPTKFANSLPAGVNVNDFALNMDLGGSPQVGWWADWRGEGLIDIYVQPDTSTLVQLPGDDPPTAWCLGRFTDVDGQPLPVCPRSLLERQAHALAGLGYDARCAFELEFFLVDERLDVLRRRGYKNVALVGGPNGKPGYMTQRTTEVLPFIDGVTRTLDAIGIPWEAFTDEAGPGQFELNLAAADPVAAADRATRAKQVLREVAAAQDRTVTFMARPVPGLPFGSGLHLHLSLARDGKPAFVDDSGGVTDVMRHWLGGWLATVAGFTSIATPTVNAFRRQVDFVAAPTTPTWGEENKAAAVRTISRNGKVGRLEHRVASADANPYLVLAAALAGGIAGLEERIEPPPAVRGLPWGLPDDRPRLPHSLTTAADALAADERLRQRLGDVFIEHWTETRRWEWLMFHTGGGDPDATEPTDWELRRYFEWV